jgi:predicted nuclease of predicted toxin-antitoxin system
VRFLADESCDDAVVRALRKAGHDVKAIAEAAAGSTDRAVLDMAAKEQRLLITEDKDFGELVLKGTRKIGAMLLRYRSTARSTLPDAVAQIVAERADELAESFVVVTPGGARIRRLRF